MIIFHVTTEYAWRHQKGHTFYAPDSYKEEGFIHCCTREQLDGVLQRYFAGRKDLLLLHLDEQKLRPVLKYEVSTGGELFPHLYGAINKDAVTYIELLF